jgi:ribose transport system substrate-binding protein
MKTRAFALTSAIALTAAMAIPVMAQDMAAPEPFADEDEIYVPIVSKGFQHQFWLAVESGAEAMAEELNMEVNFIGPESESQVDKQIDMLLAEYAKNPDAVCFAALDSVAANPILEDMAADGIPVIGFDSGVDSDIPITTAATDNLAAAALAAEKMVGLIGDTGKVGVIVHDQTSRTGIDRTDGFINYMTENHPGIEIVGPRFEGGDQLRSTDAAKDMITSNPEMLGFFGGNEGSAIGVLNAVNELDKAGEIVVIGYDSGQFQIDAIKDGTMAGAVQQDPVSIGAWCVEAAAMALQGEEVPPVIDTGFKWADATNIDDEDIVSVLYN